MKESPLTRRGLLKRSGVAALSIGVTATAGCTESLPPLGQRVQYGRVDVPEQHTQPPGASGPTYRRWFPAASALPTDDLDPGFINYTTPSNLGADVIGFDSREPHFFQKPYLDYLGVEYTDLTEVIGMHAIDTTYVLTGSFDAATVGETLAGSGYAEVDTYGNYTLFTRGDGPRTAAVTDDVVVWARHERSRAIVEAVIDANKGDVERHHEADPDFAAAIDAVGSRPWVFSGLGVDPTGEALFNGLSYTFDTENIYYIHTTLYPEGASVTEQDVKDALTSNSRGLNAWAVDIQVEGRVSTIEMGIAPENRPKQYDGVTVPLITWGIDDADTELTIHHEAGDPTPAETITLYTRTGSDRTKIDTQFADNYDTIGPGDSVTVSTPEDAAELVGEFSPPDMTRAAQFPLYTL